MCQLCYLYVNITLTYKSPAVFDESCYRAQKLREPETVLFDVNGETPTLKVRVRIACFFNFHFIKNQILKN